MKRFLLTFMLMFTLRKSGFSQAVQVKEITNKDATKILASVENFSIEQSNELLARIFKLNNGFGSAHLPETDEITYNYLITTSIYDEDLAKKVITVGPFFDPKIIKKMTSGNTITLILQHGIYKKRKNHKLIITLDNVIYQ